VRNRNVGTDLASKNKKLEKAERHMIRSRIQKLEDGERCTSYFASLEKLGAQNNTVFSLIDNDNKSLIHRLNTKQI